MVYGYARCSTNESKQDVDRQKRELAAAGAERIVFEYEHGDAKIKRELELLMEAAQSGDTIITTEVSRLSRSTRQLCDLVEQIREKRLRLVILGSVTIDCRGGEIDPMSQAFIQMAGVFAELELSMIRMRVKSGVENARAKGAALGRPRTTAENIPQAFYRNYPLYMSGTINKTDFARMCGIGRTALYKYLAIVEGNTENAKKGHKKGV